ncbi:MAG: DUF4258 domain-containing protein [Treponema sp.]|nr:DUF4258 domain-containing protein [Treponema sp.]
MLKIEDIKNLCTDDTIILTEHLITRMRQRNIRLNDIKKAVDNGEIIEQYPTDYPFPACLINGDNIHIVCSIDADCLYIITAYRPAPEKWEAGGRKRKGAKL